MFQAKKVHLKTLFVEWDQGFRSFIPQTFTECLTQAKGYSSSFRNFARELENPCP